uniref:Uncharacterized protein n=1 Tax=viral metagenome TaxID=1070528 RepID=A0A6H1ZDE3_9ZZZZ
MFGYDVQHAVSVVVSDPGADVSLPIWQVPAGVTKIEILEASILTDTTLAAGTANGMEVTLLDGGAAGAGTSVLTNALGGTAAGGTFPAWTAVTPQAWTVSEGTLDAGDWVVLKYDESGTVAMKNIVVWFSYVQGVGA